MFHRTDLLLCVMVIFLHFYVSTFYGCRILGVVGDFLCDEGERDSVEIAFG